MVGPWPHLLRHRPGEEKARAAHAAAGAQQHPRVVEIAALPQEPQGVPCADPVVAVVFAVAIAGDDGAAPGEDFVHPLDIVRGQNVVGVEHEVAVKALGPVLRNVAHQRVQGVALAHAVGAAPLIHHRPRLPGDGRGAVGAVVRHHEHRHRPPVVRLPPKAFQ